MKGPVEITIHEARLDDAGRRKLIQFYEKKPVLWDTSLKLPKKDAKDQKLAGIKELEEHFGFKFSGSELLAAWKSIRAVFLTHCPPYLSSRSLGSSVASNVALKIVSCNIPLPQQSCVKSCLV